MVPPDHSGHPTRLRGSGHTNQMVRERLSKMMGVGANRNTSSHLGVTRSYPDPRGVAQSGKSACFGSRRPQVQILPPRPRIYYLVGDQIMDLADKILKALQVTPGLDQVDLAIQLDVELSKVCDAMQNLMAKGLVQPR